MEKIEFKSQVCTTVGQSERLLELGLGRASADCYHVVDVYGKPAGVIIIEDDFEECPGDIPAWSLHRLIEIASDVQRIPISFVNWMHSDVRFDYDHLIETIQWLIECGYINEVYLED